MKEYIKLFDEASDAAEYPIKDIPFICTIESTGQNITCDTPGKMLLCDPDNVRVVTAIDPIHFQFNVQEGSWDEFYYDETFDCIAAEGMTLQEWLDSEYALQNPWGYPLLDLESEWAYIEEDPDTIISEGDVFHYVYNECSCLLSSTSVTMSDGTTKEIKDICIGDEVLSTDLLSGEKISRKVTFVGRGIANAWDEWKFDDGTTISTTHRHEFFNADKNKFVYLNEWEIGNSAVKEDGSKTKLVEHIVHNEKCDYNKITLEDSTNFFADGLLNGDRNCNKILDGQL